MTAKGLASFLLRPLARTAGRLQLIKRAWAHAHLSGRLTMPVDDSVVILGVAEVHGTGRVHLGKDLFLYRDLYFETQGEGEIHVGDRVVISRGVHVAAYSKVEVGAGSIIGEYTSIRDANHVFGAGQSMRTSGHRAAPIAIGKNAWIGRGVTILSGVVIGDNAVIGANAVVTRNVEAGSVAAGVPARPLRSALQPKYPLPPAGS